MARTPERPPLLNPVETGSPRTPATRRAAGPPSARRLPLLLPFLILSFQHLAAGQPSAATNDPPRLVELSGRVEVAPAGSTNWTPATPHRIVQWHDRLRTGPDSRATLRLSDRSVVRLQANTLVEIRPPGSPTARRNLLLHHGSIYFLNREKPADIEFETPLATGAIRGTEFLLAAAEADGTTRLVLFDGLVDLHTARASIPLHAGQQAEIAPGQSPRLAPALPAATLIQWTFYYPAVLAPGDLLFPDVEQPRFRSSLAAYRTGDLVAAQRALPDAADPESDVARIYRAALKLAVGQVDAATALIDSAPPDLPVSRALRTLIAAVSDPGSAEPPRTGSFVEPAATPSEWLARSYQLQSHSRLPEALAAARQAVALAPDFGFAWARVAELEFSLDHRRAAHDALRHARNLSPHHAAALALEGFLALDENRPTRAEEWFNQAIAADGALGPAWLGRGIALELTGRREEGRRDIQTAAALEPQRSLFRSYAAKAFSESGDVAAATKDFRRARELDPADPTPWLYSALDRHQRNEINDAIRDLEESIERNENRSVFRSRLLLDRDRAVRRADLAALYDDAGLSAVAHPAAARAVADDYSDFSGHLFLSRSLQARDDPHQFDLRLETARQSELLIANLLAPVGGANLSQLLSQADHLRFFEQRPAGFSSSTTYRSEGDWLQAATLFGNLDGFSYAFDAQYLDLNGQQPNGDLRQTRLGLQLQQMLSPADSLYLQAGYLDREGGDVARHYDPADANPALRFQETQEPSLYAGWHHEWSPGSHTLLLFAHIEDQFDLQNPLAETLFLRQSGGAIVAARREQLFDLTLDSTYSFTSVELQHLWRGESHGLILGGRYQDGSVDTRAVLSRPFGTFSDQQVEPGLQRASAYAYYNWSPLDNFGLTAGVSYDDLSYPVNVDIPPITSDEGDSSGLNPKVALSWEPWDGGLLRAAWTRSLGGLYFDNSIRLEPAQLAGFTTAFRSLAPESAVGLVPGNEFESWGLAFDQSFPTATYAGISGEILDSDGERGIGAVTNSLPIPLPDSTTTTRQTLEFRERSLSAYVAQLVGRDLSLGVSFRLSEADLDTRLPDLPRNTIDLNLVEQDHNSLLHQLRLEAGYHHPSGFFAGWASSWYSQENDGYNPARPGDTFWQHDVVAGWRFFRRQAELRFGVFNLADQDYRLNPLLGYPDLPRRRTFTTSLRLNF